MKQQSNSNTRKQALFLYVVLLMRMKLCVYIGKSHPIPLHGRFRHYSVGFVAHQV
jgi:hypothetical protein